MFDNCFDKKTESGAITTIKVGINEFLTQELHKLIIKKLLKNLKERIPIQGLNIMFEQQI